MKLNNRLSTWALTAVIAGGIVAAPASAMADDRRRKDTALALGAASALLLATQRDKTAGILVGAGALYEYSQADRDRDCRDYDRYGYGGRYNRVDVYSDRYDRYDRNYRYNNYDRYDRHDRYDRDNRRYDDRRDHRDRDHDRDDYRDRHR